MNNWIIIKIIILISVCLGSIFVLPDQVADKPPFFIYPIVTIASLFFAVVFFKGSSMHKKLTIGEMKAPLKNIFYDPLPFHHLCSIALMLSGIIGIAKGLLIGLPISPISSFELAIGIGSFSSVKLANRYFIKEPKELKKV